MTKLAKGGLRRALDDVDHRFGPLVAERVDLDFEQAFSRLATFPAAGHRRYDLTLDPSIRFWLVGRSLLAYRWERRPLEVVMIERAEADWRRLLRRFRLVRDEPDDPPDDPVPA